jgi:Holliday junction resolvase RusA-like endonuclease
MVITLTLPLPPGTNNLYATVWRRGKAYRVKSQAAREYEEWVALAVAAKYGTVKLKVPYRVVGVLYMPDWTGIDVDSLKALLDSLAKACGVNDKRQIRNYWDKVVEKGLKPELTVTITDSEEKE